MKQEEKKVLMTKGVSALMDENSEFSDFVLKCFKRYFAGDWGDVCEEDRLINEEALKNGGRLMGVYIYPPDASWKDAVVGYGILESRIWIVTEWNRTITTVLFPSEY